MHKWQVEALAQEMSENRTCTCGEDDIHEKDCELEQDFEFFRSEAQNVADEQEIEDYESAWYYA